MAGVVPAPLGVPGDLSAQSNALSQASLSAAHRAPRTAVDVVNILR